MSLSDAKIRAAKSDTGAKRTISDGGGLQIWIMPTGSKLWNFSYRYDGKQKRLAFGTYPYVGLKQARDQRDDAKRLLALGLDPGVEKKRRKAADAAHRAITFGAIADELIDKKRREGMADATLSKNTWLLDFVRPALGDRPISDITAPEILAELRKIELRGNYETARRLRGTIGGVYRYAIATARAQNDPTISLHNALTKPVVKHRPAIIDPKGFGALLRAIEGYDGAPETRIALKLLALTFVRPGELRFAEWSEINFDRALWTIPAARMKMRIEHRVPLASQALELLGELKPLSGRGKFLFPSVRSPARCMSENTLNAALRRMGYSQGEVTSHGFRSSASSMLNESGKFNPDAIEAQLAHQEANDVRRAYQRAQFWDERVSMMNWWADRIATLQKRGEVVALRSSMQ